MRSPHFAELRERLLREGVAPKHVRRTVAELEAHRQDLVAELRARGVPATQADVDARARLGSDETLAASVLARPELRSWARKRPWAAFAIVPIVGFLAALAVWMVAFVMLVEALKSFLGVSLLELGGVRVIGPLLFTAVLWGLPMVAATLCVGLAAKRRAGAAWPIAGVVAIALIGGAATMSLDWHAPPTPVQFSAGFGLSAGNAAQVATRAALTMAVALVPFLTWRRWKRAQ